MLMWLLLCWCLLSVPVGLVAGRCVAAAAGTPADVRRRRADLGTTAPRRPDAAPLPGFATAPRA
jgi:hypothetical protein